MLFWKVELKTSERYFLPFNLYALFPFYSQQIDTPELKYIFRQYVKIKFQNFLCKSYDRTILADKIPSHDNSA